METATQVFAVIGVIYSVVVIGYAGYVIKKMFFPSKLPRNSHVAGKRPGPNSSLVNRR